MAIPKQTSTSKYKTGTLGKDELTRFAEILCQDYKVYGPVCKGSEYSFQPINDVSDLSLEYQTTILPPKKLLHQPFETMFHFTTDGEVSEVQEDNQKQILFGVHPCDVNAINILDKVFMDEYTDTYYKQKRENTIIIAKNCDSVGDTCFCTSFGTGPSLEEGYDILLTDMGDNYLVEVGSETGEELVKKVDLQEVSENTMIEKHYKMDKLAEQVDKNVDIDEVSELLQYNFDHPAWDKAAEKCMACGSCTMVCPTCFCYNVIDQVDLDLKQGQRQRVWDSCLLVDFSQVAMGANFRKERNARIKQRIYHKFKYMNEQFGKPGCVGCGRCIKSCVKKIDPTQIIREIRGEDE